jgi:hypothetical protein
MTKRLTDHSSPSRVGKRSARFEDSDDAPSRISVWGLLPLIVAGLAMAQTSILGRNALRSVTVAVALCGLVSAIIAIWATRTSRASSDRTWIRVGVVLNVLILLLVLVAPGILNQWWENSSTSRRPVELNDLFVVPYEQTHDQGRPADNGWVDAATEAIRVGEDLVIRVESAESRVVAEMGNAKHLVINLRIGSFSRATNIHFTGFNGEWVPVLRDKSGRALTLKKQQIRRRTNGKAVFEDAPTGPTDIEINSRRNPSQDVLFFFDLPATLDGLHLEVPCAVFGRKGTCRFEISQLFDSQYPDRNK